MQLGSIIVLLAVIVVVAIWWYWRREVGSAYIDFLSRRRAEQQKKQHGPGYYQAGPPQSEDEPETKREATNLFGEGAEAAPSKSGSTAQPPSVSPVTPAPPGTPAVPPVSTPAPEAKPAPAQGGGPLPVSPDKTTAPTTEDVRFTVFHPREVAVEMWYTLLVYSHIDSALNKVQADAQRFKQEMGNTQREARSTAPAKLARGTEITILPEVAGVEFNPPRIAFKWVEDMQRAEFRMRAGKDLAGSAANGMVTIFVGPLIVATIKVAMLFDEASAVPVSPATDTQATASVYKQEEIFVSYSHADT